MAKYFSNSEFACHCGCGKGSMDKTLIAKLDELRELVGAPLYVNSGYRCAKRNKDIGGSKDSQHLYGKAADIRTNAKGMTPKKLAQLAEKVGFDGIGIYTWGIHVDVRGKKARWNG